MEADKLFREEFIRSLDHNELAKVLFLVIERRVGLDGPLVTAFRMWTLELVG